MPRTNDHFATKAGGAAGFFAMAVLGWNLAGGAVPVAEKSRDVAPASHRDRTSRPQRSSGAGGVAVQQLAAIRSGRNPTERMRATIDLANSLPPSDFAAWLDGGWFSLRDGAELTLFTKIIQERWKLEDPGGYAAWTMKRGSYEASKVLASWADKDPQRVAEFFKLHPDSRNGMEILGYLAKDHPALALQCLRDFSASGLSQNDSYYISNILREVVKKSSAEVEAFVGGLSGALKLRAEGVLIAEKMKTDYEGELRKLWDNPDGLKIFNNLGSSLQGKIFDDLANLPPDWRAALASNPSNFMDSKSAVKWMGVDFVALGFSKKDEKQILLNAMYSGARENPAAAFKLMAEFDLSAGDRRTLIQNTLSGKRDQADSIIALLTSESDREIARSIVNPQSASNSPKEKIETPTQWLEKVATLDPKSGENSYEYATMIREWDAAKVSALGEQFRSLPPDKKQLVAQAIVNGGYTNYFSPALAGDAVRYLITNPGAVTDSPADPFSERPAKFDPVYTASRYIGSIAVKDPETASDWVGSLPEGDAKAWSQLNLRNIWSQYDPKAADQWFKTLPAATQTQVLDLGKKNGN